MSEQNKNAVRRLFDELWNKGNLPVADELIGANYTHHDPSTPDVGRGPESEKKRVTLYRNAFPDLRLTVEDLFAEGETVVARWSCRGAPTAAAPDEIRNADCRRRIRSRPV